MDIGARKNPTVNRGVCESNLGYFFLTIFVAVNLPSLALPVIVTATDFFGLQNSPCLIPSQVLPFTNFPAKSNVCSLPSLPLKMNAGAHFLAIEALHLAQTIFPSVGLSPASATEALNTKANANVVMYFIAMF